MSDPRETSPSGETSPERESSSLRAVDIAGLTHRFGARVALDGIDLQVSRGERVALLGPNGAGKSTLMGLISHRLVPQAGRRRILEPMPDPRLCLGMVFQEDRLDRQVTARQNLELHADLFGIDRVRSRTRIDELLDRTGLADRQNERPETFSGGLKRRLCWARALVTDPALLLLDEPTTGLDPTSRRDFHERIQGLAPDVTVILATHDMVEAETLARRIVILDRGRILRDGSPEALKREVVGEGVFRLDLETGDLPHLTELKPWFPPSTLLSGRGIGFTATRPPRDWPGLVRAIEPRPIARVHQDAPSLEDVFFTLTGRHLREDEA